jgi:hypothetical protein
MRDEVTGKGWRVCGDWLGTRKNRRHRKKFLPFKAARKAARKLCIVSQTQWKEYRLIVSMAKTSDGLPANPDAYYRERGWINWGDWLGTGRPATFRRKFRSFGKARRFVHQLGLRNQAEWRHYLKNLFPKKSRLPADIPAAPEHVYKGQGWINWGDWLGTGTIGPHDHYWHPFRPARKFARSLNLKSYEEWRFYIKGKIGGKPPLPKGIPRDPRHCYLKKGWKGWPDWLGTSSARRYAEQPKKRSQGKRFFIVHRSRHRPL